MKKAVFVLFTFMLFMQSVFCASFKKGENVYVSVKSSALKSGTGFFAKTIGKVEYGDKLIVIEGNSKKTKVSPVNNQNVAGWIANGSLTAKKIAKSGSSVNASSNELALAGKGFSEEAEKAFKSENKNLNYDEVDKIEKITVSEKELLNFVSEGHLNGGE
ncbi:hypothetical protein [Treponema sp.]|uniref:hypothetical protein n=1 Tax=Treponema sp. TaxID=166 RepID=UPI00388E6D00